MNKTKTSVLTLLLVLGLAISAIPIVTPKTQAATSASDQTFSIMQISDTQHLALLSPTLYNDTTSWIVNNSASYNLQMVVNTGDITDGLNVTSTSPLTYVVYNASLQAQEWAVANASMGKLLDAGIPYCWCAGNHDQTPHGNSSGTMRIGSNYLAFNATYMRSKPYWLSDLFDSKNTAVKFTYGGYSFMIINLEFTGNSSARAWMTRLLDENPSANVIVATHAYLSVKADYSASLAAVAAWQNTLKTTLDSYPNVFLVLCGHIYSPTTSANMTRVGGRQEILFDRQEENNGTGAASVRIYTFNLTSKKVNATTYCLDTKTWLTDAYNQFSFDANIANAPVRLRASAFTNVTVLTGWTWYFFAHSIGGIGSHTYQWYEGTTPLQGQTSMVLPVTKNTPGVYTYYCKVTDAEGTTANSNTVTLTVRG